MVWLEVEKYRSKLRLYSSDGGELAPCDSSFEGKRTCIDLG